MNPSTPFIRRPVATILLTFGIFAAGAVSFFQLPVSPLPQVDYPTISVQAPSCRAPVRRWLPPRWRRRSNVTSARSPT